MGGDGRRVLPLPSVLHALLEPPHLYPFRGPEDVFFCYPVQFFDRLAGQRVPQGPAKTPFATLPKLPALELHEPFPTHAVYYRLFTGVRGRMVLRTSRVRRSTRLARMFRCNSYLSSSHLGRPPPSSHRSRCSLSQLSRNLTAAILDAMSSSVSSSTSL